MSESKTTMINAPEKSLALAKLMLWDVTPDLLFMPSGVIPRADNWSVLCPYSYTEEGLSQFAVILLRFPEVMLVWQRYFDPDSQEPHYILEPTQANILDEILRMRGEDI